MEKFYKIENNRLYIDIYVNPNSKKDEIIGIYNNRLKIKISTPAVDGKANKGIIKFLSKYFRISKSNIKIVKGEFSKEKIIEINNFSEEIIKKLEEVKNANL